MPTEPPTTRPGAAREARPEVLLVTGPSGAGRSTAIAALEDLGFEAIDNLPLSLLPRLLDPAPRDRRAAPRARARRAQPRLRGRRPDRRDRRAALARRSGGRDALSRLPARRAPAALRGDRAGSSDGPVGGSGRRRGEGGRRAVGPARAGERADRHLRHDPARPARGDRARLRPRGGGGGRAAPRCRWCRSPTAWASPPASRPCSTAASCAIRTGRRRCASATGPTPRSRPTSPPTRGTPPSSRRRSRCCA